MSLAVVLPSRGLVYSQTVDELLRELNGLDYQIFWSHGRPIPDCFTIPTEQALAGDFEHILFVEEDMVLTPGIVKKMLARDTYAVACDYPVGGGSGGTVMYDPQGRAFFTGCGLLLVRTDLLKKLPKPIWRTDIRWEPFFDDGYVRFDVTVRDDPETYGQQDVAFGLRLYANGYPIEIMDETIGQREMVKRGGRGNNSGFHAVKDRMKVVPRKDLATYHKRPDYDDVVIDGKVVKILRTHLAKLDFEPEKPDYIKSFSGIFDAPDELLDWLLIDGAR